MVPDRNIGADCRWLDEGFKVNKYIGRTKIKYCDIFNFRPTLLLTTLRKNKLIRSDKYNIHKYNNNIIKQSFHAPSSMHFGECNKGNAQFHHAPSSMQFGECNKGNAQFLGNILEPCILFESYRESFYHSLSYYPSSFHHSLSYYIAAPSTMHYL